MIWALLYILAIVSANLSIAIFGPVSAPINAFLMIGAVLTLRDVLHDRFGPGVVVVLILAGTALSALLGPDVARIAVGGAVAFAFSETIDTIVYHRLSYLPWHTRVNASNVAGAFVDSVVFFPAAFGTFPIILITLQFFAKTFGGATWAGIIIGIRKARSDWLKKKSTIRTITEAKTIRTRSSRSSRLGD